MPRNKQGTDVPAEPDSMERADAANGEAPTEQEGEVHRTGDHQAEQNRENEPPA
jgi:hypothetical protein